MNNQPTPTETQPYNTMRECLVRDMTYATIKANGHNPLEVDQSLWASTARAIRATECGAVANTAVHGTWIDSVCRLPHGHTGTHVGIHRDGTHTGFHYTQTGGAA